MLASAGYITQCLISTHERANPLPNKGRRLVGYELISLADYDSLPEDPEECFLAIEAICRTNMTRMIDENSSSLFDANVQTQYMATVSAAAEECQIRGIPLQGDMDGSAYGLFALKVQGEVARMLIRRRGKIRSFSVQLMPNTRTKIEHHVTLLRTAINGSDLHQDRKRSLSLKLDEFLVEVSANRLPFAKTLGILSLVLAGMSGVTTIAADAPLAVTNIIRLIGLDKQSEDAAIVRLAVVPKALSAPANRSSGARPSVPLSDLDEEIPF